MKAMNVQRCDSTDELIWTWAACRREIGDAGINKMYINECFIEVA
jgi:hypothetical protein